MDNENLVVSIGGMAALAKYAPAAHQDLLEDMHYLAQWVSKTDEIEELSADGYWPLAIFIHRLVSKQLANELEGVRQALDRLIELDSAELIDHQSAMTYTRDLHKLRHRRLEEFSVVVSNVKRAINEKKLIVRYGKPPYFPVVDEKRFCLDSWLENKKEDPDTTWKRYPDGRLVVKITEAEAWLDSIGVAQQKSMEPAERKSERRVTDGLRSYMDKVVRAMKDLDLDPKKYGHGRAVKKRVIEHVLKQHNKDRESVKESMVKVAWHQLRKDGEIAN
jgi:hypothetical protein